MKPRGLIIGTAYAIPEHRKKLEFLAAHFELTCATARECRGFGWVETVEPGFDGPYRLIGLPIAGAAAAGTRCWYRGRGVAEESEKQTRRKRIDPRLDGSGWSAPEFVHCADP